MPSANPSGATDYGDVDFFSDPRLVADPYPFYEHLRAQCPVAPVPRNGVLAVTGYDELTEVYRDNATYTRMLDRLRDIRIDQRHHGPAGNRQLRYVPLYIIRGLQELHLEFTATS